MPLPSPFRHRPRPPKPAWPTLPSRRFTLLGRATCLIGAELLANAVVWIAAGIVFTRDGGGLLGLALLAWTIGLRHGLDADHISAIDNATRQLVSLGQLPITVGLFFSLGHSTIVIVVNIAIAISIDIYDKLDTVGSVGGIVGASVSASFLFLIAVLNSFFLHQALRTRRRLRQGIRDDDEGEGEVGVQGGGCMVRVLSPLLRAVDASWKMYPVGILFGFGFDTASSIALLAISAVAQRGANGEQISHGKIVIFPFLFTAGMSLVDSLDSVLMLYAYAAPDRSSEEGKLALFVSTTSTEQVLPVVSYQEERERDEVRSVLLEDVESVSRSQNDDENDAEMHPAPSLPDAAVAGAEEPSTSKAKGRDAEGVVESTDPPLTPGPGPGPSPDRRMVDAKTHAMSTLSIILTLMSILVALSISIIEIMGLIGDNCAQCSAAADDTTSGLSGRWWRFWGAANDASGYIGAGIVGAFLVVVLAWYGGKWAWRRWYARRWNERQR